MNDDDMNEFREQGFDVENYNLPNLEGLLEPIPVDINAPPVLNWNTDCIVCSRRAVNLQNLFASFYNDPKADVMNMS